MKLKQFNENAMTFLSSELGLKHLKMRKIASKFIKPKFKKIVKIKGEYYED